MIRNIFSIFPELIILVLTINRFNNNNKLFSKKSANGLKGLKHFKSFLSTIIKRYSERKIVHNLLKILFLISFHIQKLFQNSKECVLVILLLTGFVNFFTFLWPMFPFFFSIGLYGLGRIQRRDSWPDNKNYGNVEVWNDVNQYF